MDPRNQVPEFKKGSGAVSAVIISGEGTHVLACEDLEKGSSGRRRWALPGGTVEIPHRGEGVRGRDGGTPSTQ
jgi:ADP-ribose pyrophosphatase YjhB (NUDIX family)